MEITKTLLQEWNERTLPEVIPRKSSFNYNFSSHLNKIIVLSGFRRVGKTYLFLGIIKSLLQKNSRKNVIYLNFEDERIPLKTEFLSDLIPELIKVNGVVPEYLFLDEIQNFDSWSKWLRRIYDSCPKTRFFVTGSSSKMSFDKIPTELRGRYLLFKIFPLSFSEFLKFKKFDVKTPESKLINLFDEYLFFGGLPEVVLSEEKDKIEIVKSYYQSVVNKDLVEAYSLKNKEVVKALLNILLNSTSYSYTRLYNSLKSLQYSIGKSSLIHYVNSIEDSFFMFNVPFFSYNPKDRIQYPKKHYFIDNVFISKISGGFSNNYGRLYENLVAVTLLRKGKEIFYWKNQQQEEVDFVVKEGTKIKQLVQVCYNLNEAETRNREVRALLKAGNELKCKNLIVISSNKEGEEEIEWFGIRSKVKFIPLWKWLLENE